MGLNLKKTKEAYEKAMVEGRNRERWEPQAGPNLIRVLPPSLKYFTEELESIAYMYMMHFNVGPNKRAVVCTRTAGENNRCPICEEATRLYKTKVPTNQALAKELFASKRYLLNILDLKSSEAASVGVQIYECGPTAYNSLLQWCNEKWGDPIDIDNGRNFTLVQIAPSGGNKKRIDYRAEPDIDKTSILDKLPSNWKEQIKKLELAVPEIKSYDEIRSILEGEVDIDEGAGKEEVKVESEPKGGTEQPVLVSGKCSGFGKDFSNKKEKCQQCLKSIPDIFEQCKREFLS